MSNDSRAVIDSLHRMVAEEMFLLGQELDDSINAAQQARLADLTATLDEVCELMASHRQTRRPGPGDPPR